MTKHECKSRCAPGGRKCSVGGSHRAFGYRFWPLDIPVVPQLKDLEAAVSGHRHWTDLFLLQEAVRRGGKLVTFDAGIARMAGKQGRAHLLVLKG